MQIVYAVNVFSILLSLFKGAQSQSLVKHRAWIYIVEKGEEVVITR